MLKVLSVRVVNQNNTTAAPGILHFEPVLMSEDTTKVWECESENARIEIIFFRHRFTLIYADLRLWGSESSVGALPAFSALSERGNSLILWVVGL
ncbi:MAG: hypothetical protein K0B14_14905 [Anaerolineaceae bacterium]|nr:hypothetical protein [Anaerolineaceae bacterium]